MQSAWHSRDLRVIARFDPLSSRKRPYLLAYLVEVCEIEVKARFKSCNRSCEMVLDPLIIRVEKGNVSSAIRSGVDPGVSCRPWPSVGLPYYLDADPVWIFKRPNLFLRRCRRCVVNHDNVYPFGTALLICNARQSPPENMGFFLKVRDDNSYHVFVRQRGLLLSLLFIRSGFCDLRLRSVASLPLKRNVVFRDLRASS